MSSTNYNFGLIDCNNFFVSCERVFNPKLNHRPVVVLSNNDGCVIARSEEAKEIGIPMGAPAFKYRGVFKLHQVSVLSSNFTLYADLSSRIVEISKRFLKEIEIYSIDEAFFIFRNADIAKASDIASCLRATILQQVGIPVSIGIAQTKTLAKIANAIAKKNKALGGVYNISQTNAEDLDFILKDLAPEKIWGIGSRLGTRLRAHGIINALMLKNAPDLLIRKITSINGLQTAHELRGTKCFNLHEKVTSKKSITSSRSFGQIKQDLDSLNQAVAFHVTRAAEKLRNQNSVVKNIHVYIRTRRHGQDEKYFGEKLIRLSQSTDFTPTIIIAAQKALTDIYRPGYNYAKAGVTFLDLSSKDSYEQYSLFEGRQQNKEALILRQNNLQKVTDTLNQKYGRDKLLWGACGVEKRRSWKMRQDLRSSNFTTNMDQILIVNAD